MTEIGDLLHIMQQNLSITRCTQLICKQDIVVRVTVIVLSFKVDGDVSLIYHKSIDFCKKTYLGSFVSVSTLFKMAEHGSP